MTVVRKKKKQSSVEDLKATLAKLIYLLEGQDEDAAVKDLKIAENDLNQYDADSAEFQAALGLIMEAFEGEHELVAYTFRRDNKKDEPHQWSEVEELYLASTSVINIVKRLSKKD